MNTPKEEFHEYLTRQIQTIQIETETLITMLEEYKSQLQTNEQTLAVTADIDDEDYDDFDFGSNDEEISTPPPAKERLCQKCLEELGMNEIDTPPKKHNFICEWCVEKRAMAQTQVVKRNTVSEQDIKEVESVETIVIEKREFKPSVKIIFWILVVALIAIAFT